MVSNLFADDEELGKLRKKDDDHEPSPKRVWSAARARPFKMLSPRFNKRRFVLPGLALVILWILYTFKPADLGAPEYRRKIPKPGGWGNAGPPNAQQAVPPGGIYGPPRDSPWAKAHGGGNVKAPKGPPPGPKAGTVKGAEPDHYYNGPIVFHNLPNSLRALFRTIGYQSQSKNVLFAASNLKSAATLLPIACDMGNRGRAIVHFTLMGRNDLPIDQLLEINGIKKEDCDAFWHDGRPDYGAYSTDPRAEAAVLGAMTHVQAYIHPQVIVTDDSVLEDVFFTRAVRQKAEEYHIPVIEMPAGQADRLSWIARLDATGLSAWHRSSIDVLVQAEEQSTGSLMRLLHSLYTADYAGISPPRLTIELSQSFDDITRQFVSNFPWPPRGSAMHSQNRLTLRHRIPSSHLSPEEASIKFMESFYPANGQENHVLVLSPNAQVSPLYLQYLKYSILEYRYSEHAAVPSQNLLGISLDLPATYLNVTQPFTPPLKYTVPESERRPSLVGSDDVEAAVNPSFLWQAPNSNAALYFGDKWVELHAFLQKRLESFHKGTGKSAGKAKLVSSTFPAWMEYALELARARGYSMLYPSSQQVPATTASKTLNDGSLEWKLVTMHDEQYSPPQEFMPNPNNKSSQAATATPPPEPPLNEPFLMPPQQSSPEEDLSHPKSRGPESLIPSYRTTLQSILPNYYSPLKPPSPMVSRIADPTPDDADAIAAPPPLDVLPILSWDGYMLDAAHSISFADFYADEFRAGVGGCKDAAAVKAAKDRKLLAGATPNVPAWREGSVDDLFCA